MVLSTGGPIEMDNPLSLPHRLLTKNNGTNGSIQKLQITNYLTAGSFNFRGLKYLIIIRQKVWDVTEKARKLECMVKFSASQQDLCKLYTTLAEKRHEQ